MNYVISGTVTAGSGAFASDFAPGEFLYKGDCNLLQLSAIRKNECKDNKK